LLFHNGKLCNRLAFFNMQPPRFCSVPGTHLVMSRSATMSPDDLRKRANRYRTMAANITDTRTVQALHELAAEYEARANRIEAQQGAEASGDRSDGGD
jgi:hypothetical protein